MHKQTVIQKLLAHKEDSKSRIFLLPLLQLPKGVNPIGTYLSIESVELSSRPLICLFHTSTLTDSNRKALTENQYFDFSISDSDYEFFFFEFGKVAEIYDNILKGAYTKLSFNAKMLLARREHPISEIAIHPELYYQDYADELETDVELLKQKVELIAPPDVNQERIKLGPVALLELQEYL